MRSIRSRIAHQGPRIFVMQREVFLGEYDNGNGISKLLIVTIYEVHKRAVPTKYTCTLTGPSARAKTNKLGYPSNIRFIN